MLGTPIWGVGSADSETEGSGGDFQYNALFKNVGTYSSSNVCVRRSATAQVMNLVLLSGRKSTPTLNLLYTVREIINTDTDEILQ